MKAFIFSAAIILAACSGKTPLTASAACENQRSSFIQYADCEKAHLAGTTDARNQAYKDFISLAAMGVQSRRISDLDAFAFDAQYKQEVAQGIAAEDADRRSRFGAAMGAYGAGLAAGAYSQPRRSVTCNTVWNTTTCY